VVRSQVPALAPARAIRLTIQKVFRPEGKAMPQAIVDPGELRRFANTLKQFTLELRDRMSEMNGHMANLSDTWRDQEHEKFNHEFEQTMHVVRRFVEATEQHIPFLLRKAERVEEYLQQR
jgi:uncharacterized protein YukE